MKYSTLAQWGLGLVLFSCLTGMSLFEPESPFAQRYDGPAGMLQLIAMLMASLVAVVLICKDQKLLLRSLKYMGPFLLFTVIFALSSSAWSPVPIVSIGRSIQLCIVLGTIFTFAAALDPDDFLRPLVLVCLILVVVNWVGVLALSDQGIQKFVHTGAWKGLHSHKNVAGRVMGFCTIVLFWFWFDSGRRLNWVLIAWVGALIFVFFTQSRTGIAAALISISAGFFAIAVIKRRAKIVRIALVLCTLSVFTAIGLLAIEFGTPDQLAALGIVDFSVSNRDLIWRLLLDLIAQSPTLGHGYGSVWGVEGGAGQNAAFGWFYFVEQGHNGVFDLAVALGLPFAILTVVYLMFKYLTPLFWSAERARFTPILFSILTYCLIVNLFESELFDRWRDISTAMIYGLAFVALVSVSNMRREKSDRSHGPLLKKPIMGPEAK